MDRYKFRGKNFYSEWVYGSLIAGNVIVFDEHVEIEGDSVFVNRCEVVDPSTVGQYTGGQDEEKTDIYDGDKLYAQGNLSDELQYVGTVVWDNADCRFEVVNYLQGGRFEYIPDGCVVRGTIHDAPELLKGE